MMYVCEHGFICLLQGMYSPASDVWSFGVTVWEVLTFCTAKPFEEMDDDQVCDFFFSYE